jgi:hypothetical protein
LLQTYRPTGAKKEVFDLLALALFQQYIALRRAWPMLQASAGFFAFFGASVIIFFVPDYKRNFICFPFAMANFARGFKI